MSIYKEHTKELYPFLVNDTFLSSDYPLRFRKNLLEKRKLVRKLKRLTLKSSKTKLNTI